MSGISNEFFLNPSESSSWSSSWEPSSGLQPLQPSFSFEFRPSREFLSLQPRPPKPKPSRVSSTVQTSGKAKSGLLMGLAIGAMMMGAMGMMRTGGNTTTNSNNTTTNSNNTTRNYTFEKETFQDYNDVFGKERDRPDFNDVFREKRDRPVNGTIVGSGGNLSVMLPGKGFTFGRKTLQDHNNAVDGEILQNLSRKLGRDWKILGRFLNIDDSTLDSFEKEHRTQEASYQMLRYWVQLNGSNATYENLAVGLRKVPRANLAEYVEKKGGNKY